MIVTTYHEKIDPKSEELLPLWQRSWEANGWQTQIAGCEDFLNTPDRDLVNLMADRLPTINNPSYERACYRRWSVMAQLGGTLSDYDVINFSINVGAAPDLSGRLVFLDPRSPCVVIGNKRAFVGALWLMLGYKPTPVGDGLHVSDMTILNQHRHLFRTNPVCVEYGDPGFETAPLVHFCSVKTGGGKKALIEQEMKRRGLL